MARTFTAPFAQVPDSWSAVATTAFTLTGTGSLADGAPTNTMLLGTAGADGAIVTDVMAIPRATCTATSAVLFIRRAADPATARHPIKSVTIAAQTVSATAAITDTNFNVATEAAPLRLGPGDQLYVGLGTSQSGGVVFNARGVNF